jgi:hypothetical protein
VQSYEKSRSAQQLDFVKDLPKQQKKDLLAFNALIITK